MKKNKIIILTLSLVCSIIIGMIVLRLFNSDDSNLTDSELKGYEEIRAVFGYDVSGYSIGFDNPIHEPMGERLIWNSTNEELNLSFANASEDAEFLLKIFWNYEEVDFSVDGSDMSTSYVFQSEYAKDENWSITFSNELDLSSDGFIGYLTPVIYISPNVHQKEAEFYEHKDYGISTTQYVFSDDNFDQYNQYNVFSSEDFQSYNDYTDEFYGLNVTNVSDILSNPSPFVTAGKGEQITLDFILGDSTGEQSEEYLLFAVLENDQVSINGQKVLPIRLPIDPETNEPIPQFGELTIDVPNDEGEYEFIAFAVPLPREILVIPIIENSFRITVVVE